MPKGKRVWGRIPMESNRGLPIAILDPSQITWIKTFTVDYVETTIKNILNRFGSNATKLLVSDIDNAYETLLFKHELIQM